MARGGAAPPAPLAGDDPGRHRRRDGPVRRCFQRLVRPRRPRGRAVVRDARTDPTDARDPGARGRCGRSTTAGRVGRRGLALPRDSAHPGPGSSGARDTTRTPPRRSRPHPRRHLGDELRGNREHPLVSRDRSDGRHLPHPHGGVRGVRGRWIPPGGSRAGSRDVPGLASRTTSAKWTRSASPTRRCAVFRRRSSCAARSVSAVPWAPGTGKPGATGSTCWSCARSS